MADQGINAPVGDGESDEVKSLVFREMPDGRLCMYLDPEGLNKAIKTEHYPVLTVDDITP